MEKRDLEHRGERRKKENVGCYWEGELPVAIATTGTLVQSARRRLVARERSGRRGKAAQQAAATMATPSPPPSPPLQTTLQDPGCMTGIIPESVSLERHPPDGFSHTSSRHFLCLLSASRRVSLLPAVAQELLPVFAVVISER